MMKVSIIIPVYNSEKYLSKCLNSVFNQTYKNLEIIAVNDGSSDLSKHILNNYKEKYKKKLILYNQENQGISVARNNGMKLATGDYIMFIDHDDFIKEDYVETFVNIAETQKADIVIGGYKRINTDNEILKKHSLKKEKYAHFFQTMPWARIYRKRFIEINGVQFMKTNIMEDFCFNIMLYLCNPKIITTDYCGYYWFYNNSSVSNTFYIGLKQNINLLKTLKELKENVEICKNDKDIYNYFFIRLSIWFLFYSGKSAMKESFEFETIRTFNWLNQNIEDYEKNHYLKRKLKNEKLKTWLILKIFIFLKKIHLTKLVAAIYTL